MNSSKCRKTRGFTAIELMVVVTIIVILVTLVGPSFISLFARKRLEGAALELSTDIQYSRSESVARNTQVAITFFGSECYVIHENSMTVANCNPSSDARHLKIVRFPQGVGASYSATPAEVVFEPLRGSANSLSITLASTAGVWQMKAQITPVGRVELCTPGSTVVGYRQCI